MKKENDSSIITPKQLCSKIGYSRLSWLGYMPYGNQYIGGMIPFKENYNSEVIAFFESKLGVIMAVKGKGKIFCFVALNYNLNFGGSNYHLSRITFKEFIAISNNSKINILNKELYDKEKYKLVVENI